MIELYLVISIVSGAPNIQTFGDMTKACEVIEANAGSHIYKEVVDRKNTATVTEGSCKAVMQFSTPGGK